MSKLALSPVETNGFALTNGEVMPPPVLPSVATNSVGKMDGHAELQLPLRKDLKPIPGRQSSRNGVGVAATDTPLPSEPSSPKL